VAPDGVIGVAIDSVDKIMAPDWRRGRRQRRAQRATIMVEPPAPRRVTIL
jgi:hypothetical protein